MSILNLIKKYNEKKLVPVCIFVGGNARFIIFVRSRFRNPWPAIIIRIFVRNTVLSRTLSYLCPHNFGRFTITRLFPDLPYNRISNDPVDTIIEISSEAVRWFPVVPILHPNVGHDCIFNPVPPCVHARDSLVVDKWIRNKVHASPLFKKAEHKMVRMLG